MGVNSLWQVISKKYTPKSCTLQQFSGKTLVVDASIWAWQFSKGFAGKPNSLMIRSLLKRICSLLVNRIKIIFVFDGLIVSPLKRKTLQERMRRRENVQQKYTKLLRRHLLNRLIETKGNYNSEVQQEITEQSLSDELALSDEQSPSDEPTLSDSELSSSSESLNGKHKSELCSFHKDANHFDNVNIQYSIEQIQTLLQKALAKENSPQNRKRSKRLARNFQKKYKFVKNTNRFGFTLQNESEEEELVNVPIRSNNQLSFEQIFENRELKNTAEVYNEIRREICNIDTVSKDFPYENTDERSSEIIDEQMSTKLNEEKINEVHHETSNSQIFFDIDMPNNNLDKVLLDGTPEEGNTFKESTQVAISNSAAETDTFDSASMSSLTDKLQASPIRTISINQSVSEATLESLLKQSANLDFELKNEFKSLLDILGIPWIDADGDAEIACVSIQQAGLADFVVTDDNDAMLFGASRIIRHLFHSKKIAQLYEVREIPFTRLQLIMFAYLLGSDYSVGEVGIGPVKASEIVLECRTIQEFQDRSHIAQFSEELFDFYLHSSARTKIRHQLQARPIDVPRLLKFMQNHADWTYQQTLNFINPILVIK